MPNPSETARRLYNSGRLMRDLEGAIDAFGGQMYETTTRAGGREEAPDERDGYRPDQPPLDSSQNDWGGFANNRPVPVSVKCATCQSYCQACGFVSGQYRMLSSTGSGFSNVTTPGFQQNAICGHGKYRDVLDPSNCPICRGVQYATFYATPPPMGDAAYNYTSTSYSSRPPGSYFPQPGHNGAPQVTPAPPPPVPVYGGRAQTMPLFSAPPLRMGDPSRTNTYDHPPSNEYQNGQLYGNPHESSGSPLGPNPIYASEPTRLPQCRTPGCGAYLASDYSMCAAGHSQS